MRKSVKNLPFTHSLIPAPLFTLAPANRVVFLRASEKVLSPFPQSVGEPVLFPLSERKGAPFNPPSTGQEARRFPPFPFSVA